MGEIADMILDGILDEETGAFLGGAVGFPRSVSTEHDEQAAARTRRTRDRAARRKRSRARQRKAAAAQPQPTPQPPKEL